jgi:hypothetical protein
MIALSLNNIDIDYGKNRYWRSHHWLFPPGSLKDIEYRYASDLVETQPGFETTLEEVRFRLRHLGYSHQETKQQFEAAVARWNRTANLGLTYDDFRAALMDIDFASLTFDDLMPHDLDFRMFVLYVLASWDTDDAFLSDFIFGLDFTITLRVLADRLENRSLPLRWYHQDLIDSGWASLEDLTDIDRRSYIVNHTIFVGRLQDFAGKTTMAAFDNWLFSRGLPRSTPYERLRQDGSTTQETTTLPTAVRNMIHHPENTNNTLRDDDLRQSIELLLEVAKGLPTSLAGLL